MSSERIGARAAATLLALVSAAAAGAQTPPTEAEAVALAFPGCEVVREELALDLEQQQRTAELAKVRGAPANVVRYRAVRKGQPAGTAYVDTRRVRTHAQTLLVVLDERGLVRRVEVLAFAEPRQYCPRPEFYAQFVGHGLDDQLRLRRGVRPVTGATLSARAAVDAVRTVLAVHAQLGAAR